MTPEQCQAITELANAFRHAEEQLLYLSLEDFDDPRDNTFPHVRKLFVTTYGETGRGINVLQKTQTLRVETAFLQNVETYLRNNPDYDK